MTDKLGAEPLSNSVKAVALYRAVALYKVADIMTGYTFRERLRSELGGSVAILQIKDLSNDAPLSRPLSAEAVGTVCRRHDEGYERYLLESDDVLFQSRGANKLATVMPKGIGKAIAASPIMVLRPRIDEIDPAYLAWFINHAPGQRQIRARGQGTDIQMFKKADLKAIKIVLPPLVIQRRMAATAQLQEEEQLLIQTLAKKRRQYVDALLAQQIEARF